MYIAYHGSDGHAMNSTVWMLSHSFYGLPSIIEQDQSREVQVTSKVYYSHGITSMHLSFQCKFEKSTYSGVR